MAEPPLTIAQALNMRPADALEAFQRRDEVRTTVSYRDFQPEEHARAFTVAKMANADLLATVGESLNRALAEGQTFDMWKKDIVPELQKAGWWGMVQDRDITGTYDPVFVGDKRLKTIFRTNMRTARAAGQWQRIQKLKDRMPYLRYDSVMDRRTRPQHAAWNGIILPVDHPFWQTHFPPNGWNCRCGVRQLDERGMKRNGFTVTTEAELARLAPIDPVGRERFGPPGDRTVRPKLPGIDHGWDYNVGFESMLGVVEKAANVILRGREAGLVKAAEEVLEAARKQMTAEMFIILLRILDRPPE